MSTITASTGVHKVEYAPRQVWLDDNQPLPDHLARLMVTCGDGPAARNLAAWDGMDYSTRCGECGAWVHA